MAQPPFHLAFPVTDLQATHHFFTELLGCSTGRTDERWIDFDFFGHQITAHLVTGDMPAGPTNPVDGKKVPVQHFGAILEMGQWEALADRLRQAEVEFIIEPYIRFQGQPGEQATMFLLDPSGNALEFKAFGDPARIFATE
jgi:uncharacterized protein